MSELKRMLGYVVSTLAVILFMVWLTQQEGLSGNFLVAVAVLLVIVLPVAIGILLARRERQRRDHDSGNP